MVQVMLSNDQPPTKVVQALERGERLLWSGAPRQGLRIRTSDLLLIPFSLLWGGFAIFWEFSVVQMPHAPLIMKLAGIPFVLVGLYFVVGRFFAEAKVRENTVYALTNERILIFSGVFQRETKSLSLRNIPEVSVVTSRDTSGTISFGSTPTHAAFARGMPGWPGMSRGMPPQFDMIDNVEAIAARVREAQRHAAS